MHKSIKCPCNSLIILCIENVINKTKNQTFENICNKCNKQTNKKRF